MTTEERMMEIKGKLDELALELGVEKSASYAKGFEDGKMSMGNVEDKIYSQAEMDAVVSPLNEKISGLEGSVSELGGKVSELNSEIEKLKGETEKAVAAKVAEMVSDFEGTQVDDAAFLAKYKPAPVEPAPSESPAEEIPAEVPSEESPIDPEVSGS